MGSCRRAPVARGASGVPDRGWPSRHTVLTGSLGQRSAAGWAVGAAPIVASMEATFARGRERSVKPGVKNRVNARARRELLTQRSDCREGGALLVLRLSGADRRR